MHRGAASQHAATSFFCWMRTASSGSFCASTSPMQIAFQASLPHLFCLSCVIPGDALSMMALPSALGRSCHTKELLSRAK